MIMLGWFLRCFFFFFFFCLLFVIKLRLGFSWKINGSFTCVDWGDLGVWVPSFLRHMKRNHTH